MSEKPNYCRVKVPLDYRSKSLEPKDWGVCGRPLPCLLHTAYEPEFPRAKLGPRVAVHAEVCAGTTCRNCLRAVEIIHRPGGPTLGIRCLLHEFGVHGNWTCDAFEWPPVLAHQEDEDGYD